MFRFLSNVKKFLIGAFIIGIIMKKILLIISVGIAFILIEVYQGLFIME